MAQITVRDQLMEEVDHLTPEQQAYLLDVVRRIQTLTLPPGTSGSALVAHMDDFQFVPGAVDEMMQIINEGCENIDWDEWQ